MRRCGGRREAMKEEKYKQKNALEFKYEATANIRVKIENRKWPLITMLRRMH